MDVPGLRQRCRGEVLLPGDEGYERARVVWNGNVDRHPSVLVRCERTEDVVAALSFARDCELEVSVRGGGHSFAGFGLSEGGVTIDLTMMRSVVVDSSARRARCGGGTTWAELDAAGQRYGLAVPGGMVSHTGVAGLTLGGGVGWLTRKLGLSCDHLSGAEVVTADGRIVHVSARENPELLWGLRGGGGNFGVVTSLEFALSEVGPAGWYAMCCWGIETAPAVLRLVRELCRALPDEVAVLVNGMSAPVAPFVPERFRCMPVIAVVVAGFAGMEEPTEVIARLISVAPPLFEVRDSVQYARLQRMFDESAVWGMHTYQKGLYLDELSDDVIDLIVERLPEKHSVHTTLFILALGGEFSRVPEDDTAFGGSRKARFVVNIQGTTATAEELTPERDWVRSLWHALTPYAHTAGYVNFMSDYQQDQVRASYGAAKYARLTRLKAMWDPHNIFHLNVNISPGGE
ncbi:FAD-binding oxidoreductase [Nocardia sp. NPDC050799]|uniref:FAD-binding oxidoreductase n=1 Tax=Nocardia sp. NPDC050799 TaxID=3154842 RepID=UPI0033E65512